MRRRLFLLNIIFLVFSAAVVARLFQLQVFEHETYQALAEDEHGLYKTLVPARGEIRVHSGKTGDDDIVTLATNVSRDKIFAVPPDIKDKAMTATALAPILDIKAADILTKISQPNAKWVLLKKELPESASLAVKNLKLPGLHLQAETFRFYPENEFASQVLGFVGFNGDKREGQYGVEQNYEKFLAGQAGSVASEKTATGAWISRTAREIVPARDGADIILTLNHAIQFKAEEVLRRAVALHQADSGSLTVMDPRTGAILAIANYPAFNPNTYSQVEDADVYRNRTISDTYEPGSIFKAITVAAALDAGVITPDMTYEDPGVIRYDRFVIRNSDNKAHGIQTMTQVLEQSLNTGAIFVQDLLGPDKFLAAVRKFGFGRLTGIGLPGETAGNIQNLVGGGDVHYATASFGQGITVTPLQVAQAFSAIANGGKMMKPYIVEEIDESDGKKEVTKPEAVEQVISAVAASKASAMLVSVVENGHGKQAGVPGYYVAGKTGTAQIANPDGPGYIENANNGTFAGFAPVDNPVFTMVVKIENPKGVKFAESTAAPAFGEMARFLLNYFRVPPTR